MATIAENDNNTTVGDKTTIDPEDKLDVYGSLSGNVLSEEQLGLTDPDGRSIPIYKR